MAVPKNYNQLEKRVESLNDLTFYTASYEYEFTKEFKENLETEYENANADTLTEAINGTKEFSALNYEVAEKKVSDWLGGLIKEKILEDYEVTEIKSQSFYDKIKDKKLDGILNMGKET